MNILYVTPYIPSRIRTRPYSLIRALVTLGHRIHLLTAAGTLPEERGEADELRDWGMPVEVFPVSLARSLGNCLQALPTRQPLQAAYSYHPGMARRLRQLVHEQRFDVVHVEHLRAARLGQAADHVPAVYDSVDCISLLFEQTVRTTPQWRSRLMAMLDLARTRRYEAELLTRYRQVVVTSQRDKAALESLAHRYLPSEVQRAPVTVVTNGVDVKYFAPAKGQQRDGRTVIFTGKMSYHANVAGALYFAHEVLPRIWQRNPQVRFQIVGKDPPQAVKQLARDARIEVTGYVKDLRPYLAQATVAVCPVAYAVGIQNKVLEAMAMQVPVVCTAAAFAGLGAREEEDILVADSPETFAAQILRVCSDLGLAAHLAAAGRRYVETQHSWEASAQRLSGLYDRAKLGIGPADAVRDGNNSSGREDRLRG